jgi:hypothetical protein
MTLRLLRAGPVTAHLDGIDLRYVHLGRVELVRRIYAAVRDREWGTVVPELGEIEVEQHEDRFEVRFAARHRSADVDFSWRGAITGEPDGTIAYVFDGRARRKMLYARIGLCVHHPRKESLGRPFRARTPGGAVTGELPVLIAPQRFENGVYVPLFPSFDRLEVELEVGGSVLFEFDGDLWETEDHRNWTDANFKSYSTPLALGFPHELDEGETLAQRVAISLVSVPSQEKPPAGPIQLTIQSQVARFPPVGLAMAGHGRRLAPHEFDLLRELGPAHLRADIRLGSDDWLHQLKEAQDACRKVGCALELALHLRPEHRPQLEALADALAAGPPTARVLVVLAFGATATSEETTPGEIVELARSFLREAVPGALFAGGTDLYFCELNRTRPRAEAMEGVFYALMPQMHAFSDLDIMENLEAQGDTVSSARALAGGKAVIVSPVTLKGRFAYRTASAEIEDTPAGNELPDSVDTRQATNVGAAWTAGSLKFLAEAGADSVTYYETTGWRGVVETANGPPLPSFPSQPGQVFPLYGVLAAATRWQGADVLACDSTAPLRSVGLAVQDADGIHVLIANLTPQQQEVAVSAPRGESRLYVLEPFDTRVEIW